MQTRSVDNSMSDLERYIRKTVTDSGYMLASEQLEWFVEHCVNRFQNIRTSDPGLWPIVVGSEGLDWALYHWLQDYARNPIEYDIVHRLIRS